MSERVWMASNVPSLTTGSRLTRSLTLGAKFAVAQQIALARHADQRSDLGDDRQAADALRKHRFGGTRNGDHWRDAES